MPASPFGRAGHLLLTYVCRNPVIGDPSLPLSQAAPLLWTCLSNCIVPAVPRQCLLFWIVPTYVLFLTAEADSLLRVTGRESAHITTLGPTTLVCVPSTEGSAAAADGQDPMPTPPQCHVGEAHKYFSLPLPHFSPFGQRPASDPLVSPLKDIPWT